MFQFAICNLRFATGKTPPSKITCKSKIQNRKSSKWPPRQQNKHVSRGLGKLLRGSAPPRLWVLRWPRLSGRIQKLGQKLIRGRDHTTGGRKSSGGDNQVDELF